MRGDRRSPSARRISHALDAVGRAIEVGRLRCTKGSYLARFAFDKYNYLAYAKAYA
jgi:hypothetical protein